MDLEPEPESINDVVEEETDRGIRRPPFMKEFEDDEDENGVDCLRYWKGELLRPLDEEAAIDRKNKK